MCCGMNTQPSAFGMQNILINREIYQFKNQLPPPPIDVTADVQLHAEMNDTEMADESEDENADVLPEALMDKPVVKKQLMATAEQKAIDDEMFSIDFDVPWRTASQNLYRYRTKSPDLFTGGHKSSGLSVKVRFVQCQSCFPKSRLEHSNN